MVAPKILLAALGLVAAAPALADCRIIDDSVRIDSLEVADSLQDVCEITGGLGIFTDGIEEITLPNLASVNLINVEAYGLKAVAFPKLKKADFLYLSGGQLEVAEFPHLRRAGTINVQSRNLKFLNFPALGAVNKFYVRSNPNLEFIFVDQLYDVGESFLVNNPVLNPATESVIMGSTRVLTDTERADVERSAEEIREYKRRLIQQALDQPPPPPTGHQTVFDSFGMTTPPYYYYRYNDAYWGYWNYLRPWGYHRYLWF
jgi:hypothetical protein